MNPIYTNNQCGSLRAQARLLMSQSRHKQQYRQQSMLLRAAAEVGINT